MMQNTRKLQMYGMGITIDLKIAGPNSRKIITEMQKVAEDAIREEFLKVVPVPIENIVPNYQMDFPDWQERFDEFEHCIRCNQVYHVSEFRECIDNDYPICHTCADQYMKAWTTECKNKLCIECVENASHWNPIDDVALCEEHYQKYQEEC